MPGKIGTGIDIGSTALRIARLLFTKNRPKLVNLWEFPLPGSVDDKFSAESAELFKQFLKQQNIKISKATAGISGNYLNIRYLKLPFTSATRIPHVVEMDMAQFTEKATTTLSYSYMPLALPENKAKPQTVVAIAIVHDRYLNQLNEFFKKSGVGIRGFVPNTLALHTCLSQFTEPATGKILYLADIGHSNTDVVISVEGHLYFFRNINSGSNLSSEKSEQEYDEDFLDEENDELAPKLERFERQSTIDESDQETLQEKFMVTTQHIPDIVTASIKFARFQTELPTLKIDRIIVAGSGSKQKGLTRSLKASLQCPVSHLQIANINTADAPSADRELLNKYQENFGVSLGLACLDSGPELPMKIISIRQTIHELVLRRHLFEYAAIALVILVSIFTLVVSFSDLATSKDLLVRLNSKHSDLAIKIVKLQGLQEKNQNLRQQLAALQNAALPNRYFLEILAWLRKKIPPQMYLTAINLRPPQQRPLFTFASKYRESLDRREIDPLLRQAFAENKYPLSANTVVEPATNYWLLVDGKAQPIKYYLLPQGDKLAIYVTSFVLHLKGVIEESAQDVYSVLKEFKQLVNNHPRLRLSREIINKTALDLDEEGKLEFELYLTIVF